MVMQTSRSAPLSVQAWRPALQMGNRSPQGHTAHNEQSCCSRPDLRPTKVVEEPTTQPSEVGAPCTAGSARLTRLNGYANESAPIQRRGADRYRTLSGPPFAPFRQVLGVPGNFFLMQRLGLLQGA